MNTVFKNKTCESLRKQDRTLQVWQCPVHIKSACTNSVSIMGQKAFIYNKLFRSKQTQELKSLNCSEILKIIDSFCY